MTEYKVKLFSEKRQIFKTFIYSSQNIPDWFIVRDVMKEIDFLKFYHNEDFGFLICKK
jgi:hypothetical protein